MFLKEIYKSCQLLYVFFFSIDSSTDRALVRFCVFAKNDKRVLPLYKCEQFGRAKPKTYEL